MGSGSIAISLPFSCILGLLASMTSTTMGRGFLPLLDNAINLNSAFGMTLMTPPNLFSVRRKHVWVYAIFQFVMVVLAGRLFYSLVRKSCVCVCVC